MKLTHYVQWLVVSASFALLTFLYFHSQVANPELQYRLEQHLTNLREQDALLKHSLLKLRTGIVRHYDGLVDANRKIGLTLTDLEDDISRLDRAEELVQLTTRYQDMHKGRQDDLDRFKRKTSLINNSLDHFPSLAKKYLETRVHSDDHSQIGHQRIMSLIYSTLANTTAGNDVQIRRANSDIKYLREIAGKRDDEFLRLLNHAEIINNEIAIVDEIAIRITADAAAVIDRKIQYAYQRFYGQKEAIAQQYRSALFAFSIFLILVVIFFIFRLNRTQVLRVVLEEKKKLDQILHNVPRAVITTDKSGIIKTFNPAAEQTFGHEEADALGENVSILMPELYRIHHDRFMESYIKTGVSKFIDVGPRRLAGLHKDGSEFPMELALAVFSAGKKRGFIAVAKDISDEMKAETDLLEHRDLLQKEVDLATVELKVKAEELEHSLAKEKELNELQRQFVTMASHEFRTPLAIIDSTAQRLRSRADDGRMTPEDAVQRVEKIRGAVKRMTKLMESTLSAARMEDGRIAVEIEPCNIGKILQDACTHQQELATDHLITYDLAGLPEAMQADPGALEQVFTNLLSNAVKYAPDAPHIEVIGRTEIDHVVITVRDLGLGIDEDDLPNMFQRFFRARTSEGITGTGIGLNLLKTLVELHGGSVSVESKKGTGSTFTVKLPINGPSSKEPMDYKAA